MKSCEIHLPYYNQGDDFNNCLRTFPPITKALKYHSNQLQYAANMLLEIKKLIDKFPGETTIDADCHYINLTGSDELVDALVAAELATIPDWYDEEEDEDFEDEEDEE